jgi:hypothetical protein
MEFSSVVLAAPTIRAVHAVTEKESAADRPAMDGGRGEGQEEGKGMPKALAQAARKTVSEQSETESGGAHTLFIRKPKEINHFTTSLPETVNHTD